MTARPFIHENRSQHVVRCVLYVQICPAAVLKAETYLWEWLLYAPIFTH